MRVREKCLARKVERRGASGRERKKDRRGGEGRAGIGATQGRTIDLL